MQKVTEEIYSPDVLDMRKTLNDALCRITHTTKNVVKMLL
jgi:hypothetical protein